MEQAPLAEQQAYFEACLSPQLLASIDSSINDSTPVLEPTAEELDEIAKANAAAKAASEAVPEEGKAAPAYKEMIPPVSCFALLHKQFLNVYPIFARRLDFFRCSQRQSGQLYTAWICLLYTSPSPRDS